MYKLPISGAVLALTVLATGAHTQERVGLEGRPGPAYAGNAGISFATVPVSASVGWHPAARCGTGNRSYHFGGTLTVDHGFPGGGGGPLALEGVGIRVVRQHSPVKGAQRPDGRTGTNGGYDLDCNFARDRNGAWPGGNRINFLIQARFRNREFRVRRAGWAQNNWFDVGRRKGCNRSGGFGVSACDDHDFPDVDRNFDTSDTPGRHAYLWWFYNDLQDRMEHEDIGLTDRPFFNRLLTVSYPANNVFQSSSSFLFNIFIEEDDWDDTRILIHEYMHRWDVGKLGGEGHVSCLADAHHQDADNWRSSRCSAFMEGFAEAAAEALEADWYGGTIRTLSHEELRAGQLGFADAEDNTPVESRGEAERRDVGWENFLNLIVDDDEMAAVQGSATCDPTDVSMIEMLEVLQDDAARKANWHDIRPQATFAWFTDLLQGQVAGFDAADAEMYQKLGDPSMNADDVCGDTPVSERHTIVIRSSGVPGATSYVIQGGGDLQKEGGSLEGFSVSRQATDNLSGNRAQGRVSSGNDGWIVDGKIPDIQLDQPDNARIYVDGERYYTIVIVSDDIPGSTDYVIEGEGTLLQRGGELGGFPVTIQGNDVVTGGNRAEGTVAGGNDGYIMLGGVPDVTLSNPANAEVYINGVLQ